MGCSSSVQQTLQPPQGKELGITHKELSQSPHVSNPFNIPNPESSLSQHVSQILIFCDLSSQGSPSRSNTDPDEPQTAEVMGGVLIALPAALTTHGEVSYPHLFTS